MRSRSGIPGPGCSKDRVKQELSGHQGMSRPPWGWPLLLSGCKRITTRLCIFSFLHSVFWNVPFSVKKSVPPLKACTPIWGVGGKVYFIFKKIWYFSRRIQCTYEKSPRGVGATVCQTPGQEVYCYSQCFCNTVRFLPVCLPDENKRFFHVLSIRICADSFIPHPLGS